MAPLKSSLMSSSSLVHRKAPLSESKIGLEFVLTSERPGADRLGDVTSVDGIDLANYTRNPIVIFNNHVDQPIGRMLNVRVDGGKLKGNLHLAPKTTSPRLAEIHALVDAGILRAVSIGVIPKESLSLKSGAKHHVKSELVSISLVAIPVNVDALMSVKGASKEIKKEIFKTQTRNASLAERIAASKAAIKSYNEEEKKEVLRRAKAKLTEMDEAKAKSDRLARNERLKAESKARVAKQRKEEDQARQDRENYQGFQWEGKDYFVQWRGHKIPIPDFGGRKEWKRSK